jgi:hypothetical protein
MASFHPASLLKSAASWNMSLPSGLPDQVSDDENVAIQTIWSMEKLSRK